MKKFLSLVLALVMTMSLVTVSAGAKDFTDADDITYAEAVDVMSAVKVIDGYTEGDFRPDTNLTRGAAAKIICNMILGPTTASALRADAATFKDVPVDHTFAGYIAYCSQQGIISGYADGTFRPAAPLTGYAFMKMLLGALGYDGAVEGYVGPNWSISVAKRALNLGLNDGLVEEFNGVDTVTREEACLYALNTLTSDMVAYDSRTTVSVGGSEVIIAGSKAEAVENKAKVENIFDDDVLQFAEKYFTNLKLNDTTDTFERPATEWKVKSETIGVYTAEADLTYTTGVKAGTIYKDLGLTDAIAAKDVTLYVNGEETDHNISLRKGNDDKFGTHGAIGSNGVLTEVWYDADEESVIISEIVTYFGEVDSVYEAKASKDAYVSINGISEATISDNFETEAFEEGDAVLYTYSEKDDCIVTVKEAEAVEGVVDEVVNKANDRDNSNVTVDGTKYTASADIQKDLLSSLSVDATYTVYLDEYGYAIHASEDEYVSGDYALVYDIQSAVSNEHFNGHGNRASLVFADGKTKVVDLAKDYADKGMTAGTIVTYKVDEDGDYVLKAVKKTISVDPASTDFLMKNGVSKVRYDVLGGDGTDKYVYTNSKTTVVVKDSTKFSWDAYTGTKTMPSVNDVDVKGNVQAYMYCKSGTMTTIMFVMPGSNALVTDVNKATVFVVADSVSDLIHNRIGDYFTYNAIVDGEVKTIKVDASVTNAGSLGGFYDKYTMDGELIDSITPAAGSSTGKGIDKTSEDYTITILKNETPAGDGTYTVDKDTEIYLVNEDEEISSITYAQIKKDVDDKIYFNVNSDTGMVDYLVIEKENDKDNAQAAGVTVTADKPSAVVGETVTLTAKVALADKHDEIVSYQWYKDTDGNLAVSDKIDGATSKTLTVTADVNATYFCEVTTFNDRVDGKDTAVAYGSVAITVGAYVEQTNVVVNFQVGTTPFGAPVVVKGTVDSGVLVTVTEADLAGKIPAGYKVVSGLPASFTVGEPAKVTVTLAADADSIEDALAEGDVTLTGNVTLTDPLTIPAGTTLTVEDQLTLTGAAVTGELVVNGTVTMDAASSMEKMTFAPGAELTIASNKVVGEDGQFESDKNVTVENIGTGYKFSSEDGAVVKVGNINVTTLNKYDFANCTIVGADLSPEKTNIKIDQSAVGNGTFAFGGDNFFTHDGTIPTILVPVDWDNMPAPYGSNTFYNFTWHPVEGQWWAKAASVAP